MSESSLFTALRQPPANIMAEQALLGALLHNNKALDRCPGLLSEHFADPVHARVYAAIVTKVGAGRLADGVSLKSLFEGSGVLDEVGGASYLAVLMNAMVGTINATEYSACIIDAAIRRKLIDLGEVMINAAFGSDPGVAAASIARLAVQGIEEAAQTVPGGDRWVSLDVAMDSALAAFERAQRGETSGISSGFSTMDERLGGLEPGLVYVIAGRPGMGKSALGHSIAVNAARNGVGVLELSLEMSTQQLGRRTLATAAGVPIGALKRGSRDMAYAEEIVKARKELAGLPLSIDDTAGQTPAEIAATARRYRRKHGLGLIMIDHLNLMRPDKEDARHGGTWATEQASGTVLQIAKNCQCPVILLAQLNRGVEGREDKRPGLADLRQAGAIEQDAYAVGFVYREEYYLGGEPKQAGGHPGKLEELRRAWADQKEATRGKAELIWAKVRDGAPGVDRLTFDGPTATFGEEGQDDSR